MHKAPSVGAQGHAHRRAVCPLAESRSRFAMIFFPLFAQGEGEWMDPTPPWLDGSSSPAPRIEPQLGPLLRAVPPAVWGNYRPCSPRPAPSYHAVAL